MPKLKLVNLPEILKDVVIAAGVRKRKNLTSILRDGTDLELYNYYNGIGFKINFNGELYKLRAAWWYRNIIRFMGNEILINQKLWDIIGELNPDPWNADTIIIPDFRYNEDTCTSFGNSYILNDCIPDGVSINNIYYPEKKLPSTYANKLYGSYCYASNNLSDLFEAIKVGNLKEITGVLLDSSNNIVSYNVSKKGTRLMNYIYLPGSLK